MRLLPSTVTDPATGAALSACPALDPALISALSDDGAMATATHGDLHVFVTARPTAAAVNAETVTCLRDGFGRPAVAHINVNAALLASLAAGAPLSTVRGDGRSFLRNLLRHELMHALALTWSSFAQWRGPNRRLLVRVTDTAPARGLIATRFLVTPWARDAVALHANATLGPQLIGLELSPDGSASRTALLQV